MIWFIVSRCVDSIMENLGKVACIFVNIYAINERSFAVHLIHNPSDLI